MLLVHSLFPRTAYNRSMSVVIDGTTDNGIWHKYFIVKLSSSMATSMCDLSEFSHLALAEPSLLILKEELEVWHRAYLPIGRTVLDLGAGCGETAQFYLNHGAEKVICVESNPEFLKLLRQNFDKDPRIMIVDVNIDSIKCDIEGSEKNMIIETHFPAYLERQYAFKHQATVNIWKLKEMRNVLSMIRTTNKLLSRIHYARIQIAHAIREAMSLT